VKYTAGFFILVVTNYLVMKRMILLITILLTSLVCKAPEFRVLYILCTPAEQPFEHAWAAVSVVEAKNDPLAYNPYEQAYGLGQIRPVRLNDFNRRTGKHYSQQDMFNPVKNKEVFMYYAVKIGPYDINKVIRDWNGSGPMTFEYLKKVKAAQRKLNF
jgi:hypothetical protein